MRQKTERFEMRLDPGMLDRVDDWRSRQADRPSRAEAMRRLMETGLASAEDRPLTFSDGEKLITRLLCDLHEHLKIDGEIDTEFVREVLVGGHYWGLEWEYQSVFHRHEDRRETVSDVVDALNVWWFVEQSYEKLSKKDKDRVEKEAEPFGKIVKFPGFDGNYEGEHLAIARFLIEKLDRFVAFKDRNLNSHVPSVDGYRRMAQTFEPMRNGLIGGNLLSAAQIIKLLKARRRDDA